MVFWFRLTYSACKMNIIFAWNVRQDATRAREALFTCVYCYRCQYADISPILFSTFRYAFHLFFTFSLSVSLSPFRIQILYSLSNATSKPSQWQSQQPWCVAATLLLFYILLFEFTALKQNIYNFTYIIS